jgi:hypothetical protein
MVVEQPQVRRDPYRVVVWGPGGVGGACIREILKRPEFELVGVLGFSPGKVGRDVGELVSRDPVGLLVTDDKAEIFALDADVVIWTGNPFGAMEAMEDEILRLLESGKNVVHAAGFHFPPRHGATYVDRLETACRKGGTTVFGSGENPGFWFDRVVPTLTGLCTTVESIYLEEYVNVAGGGTNAETLAGVGFGLSEDQIKAQSEAMDRMWAEYFYVESMEMVAQSTWGRPLEHFEVEHEHYLAEEDVVLDMAAGDPLTMTVERGRILGMTHTFTGYVDGEPRVRTRVNWFLGPEHSPFEQKSDDKWHVEIEAKPVSIRGDFEAFASLKGDQKFRGDDPTPPFMYVTGMPLVQAIPIVVAAEPGFVTPSVFANCVPDFRVLADRRSLVDHPKSPAIPPSPERQTSQHDHRAGPRNE